MDNLSEDSGYVNRGIAPEAFQIEGSRIRHGSTDAVNRIEDAPDQAYADHVNVLATEAHRDRRNGSRMVADERNTLARQAEKEDRRRQREKEKRRQLPVATQEELAALKAEPEKDSCVLPVCCNNIKVFCLLVSAIFLLHGIVSKYTLEVLPSIGNRYPITQLEQEFVTGVEKIGFIITLIFVGFFGNRMNKVSAISSGSFLTAVGSVIMCTPYFIYGLNKNDNPAQISDYASAGLCKLFSQNTTQAQCDFFVFDDNKTGPFSLFCLAQFIIGIGAALYSTLALVYLEDNAKMKQSSLMIGISLSSHSIGSFLGTLMAQWFRSISLPENAAGEMTTTVKGEQVGAWWLGYPIFACIALLLGTCTLWFPDWFVVPPWLKRRRFKKRLLRYRRKKRVIASKKRKEQLKKIKKAKKAKKQSKRNGNQNNRSRHGGHRSRRNRSETENPQSRRRRNRTSRNDRNGDSSRFPSQANGQAPSDSVPDLVATHNGVVPEESTRRGSHHSNGSAESNPLDQTTTDNIANTAEEEARKKERERRRRRRKRQERRRKRYRRIEIRKEKLADLPRSLYKLIKNSVLLSSVIGSALAAYLLTGYTTELPTYLRIQFQSSSNSASIAASFAGPVAMAVGTIGGALYAYKFEINLRRASLVTVIALAISTLLLPFMFALKCDLDPIIPIEIEGRDITVDCTETCDCLNTQMELIHASDGQIFLSPCHAGCKDIVTGSSKNDFEYTGCSCIPIDEKALSGVGDTDCKLLIPSSLLVFVIVMLCSVGIVPAVTIFMRFARDKKRSLVVGYAFWMIYLFGYVPGTPIFRSLRNDRCSLWKEDCLEEEICWTYDREQYRYAMNGLALVFNFIATLSFACNYYILRTTKTDAAPDAEARQNERSRNEYDNPMMEFGDGQAEPANFELHNETGDNITDQIDQDRTAL